MGVDICIDIEAEWTDAEVVSRAYDLARRVPSSFLFEHPCLVRDPDEPTILSVQTYQRWWGPDYERGNWPVTRSVLDLLLSWKEAGHINQVWHYGDHSERLNPWTPGDMRQFDRHFQVGHWSYRWDHSRGLGLDDLPDGCVAPVDAYGKTMIRNGWGANFASFGSPATGEQREWNAGVWTERQR